MLIACGDVSDELAALETALATLASKFAHVFYVPGGWEGGPLQGCLPQLAAGRQRGCQVQRLRGGGGR